MISMIRQIYINQFKEELLILHNGIKAIILMRKNIPLIINISLITVFLLTVYHKALLSPNNYIFSGSGDGLKSYYSSVYQSKDKLSFHFNGTGYPYGENYLFTDCQPVMTSFIKIISYVFPSVLKYNVGIINLLLLLSIFFTSIILYLILVKYKVNGYFAACTAFFITVLSPQIFRLPAHPFLSYSVAIPLTWYLFLKYQESQKKWKWSIIICLNILIWFLVHSYLGMINVAIFMIYYLLKYLWNIRKNRSFHMVNFSQIVLQFVIPVLAFLLITKTTDKVTGRSTNPYGFMLYNAEAETVFIPIDKPVKPLIQKISKIPDQNWEGWSYIGIASDLMLFILLVWFVVSLFSKRSKNIMISVFEQKQLKILLVSAIIILLYSMGYPFIFHLQWIAEKFPIIKQFRSLGRFAWAFYFISTVVTTYLCWRFFQFFKEKNVLRFFFLILPVTFFIEGIPYHQNISKQITITENYFDAKMLPAGFTEGLRKIDAAQYQSIIPLPFFCTGSDNFGKGAPDGSSIYLVSEIFSYYKSLPIMTQLATRTSIWQAKNFMQILSPGYYKKNIKNDLKSNKDFLIVYSNESLNEYEQNYLDRSKLLYKSESFSLYSLSYDILFSNTANEEIGKFNDKIKTLKIKNNFLVNDTSAFLYFDGYEDKKNSTSMEGSGAYSGMLKDYNTLAEIPENTFKADRDYKASFWMYNKGENFGQDMISSMLIVQEGEGEEKEWTTIVDPCTSLCINGDWSLAEINFRVKDPSHKITIIVKGKDNSTKSINADDLLIRENQCEVYKIMEEDHGEIKKLFKNNQMISVSSY
jgi:hypothetical protein